MADEMGQIWRNITLRKAEYLREFAKGRTEKEPAAALGVTFQGARSAVEALKSITGCGSVRDLGRFWREGRQAWLEFCAVAAGISTLAYRAAGTAGILNAAPHPCRISSTR